MLEEAGVLSCTEVEIYWQVNFLLTVAGIVLHEGEKWIKLKILRGMGVSNWLREITEGRKNAEWVHWVMENNPGYHQRVYHPRSRLCLLCPYLCLLWTTLPSLMVLRWVSFFSCVSLQVKSLFARLSCSFIVGKIDYIIYWLLMSTILYIKHSFMVFCFVCFWGQGEERLWQHSLG